MQHNEESLVGIGLYSVPEASRLTRVSQPRIRHWVSGYRYRRDGVVHHIAPVWKRQIDVVDHTLCLGFLDLMEVRFVEAFREQEISWPVIRLAAARARELLKTNHPFSMYRFRSDGRDIFAELVEETGEKTLLSLVRNQYAFEKVVSPSLYKSLEFSDEGAALRWYPLWPKQRVVVDPDRAFGRPIVSEPGVPTDILADAVRVEGDVQTVAKWFEVSREDVRAAVQFERALAA